MDPIPVPGAPPQANYQIVVWPCTTVPSLPPGAPPGQYAFLYPDENGNPVLEVLFVAIPPPFWIPPAELPNV